MIKMISKSSELALILAVAFLCTAARALAGGSEDPLAQKLMARLKELGFTGNVEATLEKRLGRSTDRARADLGRLLWFDTIAGLHNDNTCAGCHSPTRGFGNTESLAIAWSRQAGQGGPDRTGRFYRRCLAGFP